jgi:hypothetical protein
MSHACWLGQHGITLTPSPSQQMATGKPRCRVVCAGSSVIVTFKFDALLARRGHASDVPLTHNIIEAADPSLSPAHPPTRRPNMPSLLVIVFAVELVVQLVNTIGATTINNLVRAKPSSPVPELVLTWDLDSYGASISPSRRLSRGSSPSNARSRRTT